VSALTWLLAGMLLPSAAAAQDQKLVVKALTEAAFKDFGAKSFRAGITKMEEAHAILPKPEFLFNIALAYGQWPGHCKEALDTFDRFLTDCGRCELRSTGEERRREVAVRCQVVVQVATTPPGAVVAIDGIEIGPSPIEGSLLAGDHEVVARLDGYEVATAKTSLIEGKNEVIRLDLVPRPGRIELTNRPDGADVLLDGAPISGTAIDVRPGAHVIELRGSTSGRHEVEARSGQAVTVDLGVSREAPPTYAPYFWTATVIGGAGLLTAGISGILLKVALDAEEAERAEAVPDRDRILGLRDRAVERAIIADVGLGVGLAGAAAAIVLFLLEPREPAIAVIFGKRELGIEVGF
jgi:hypothetical protein